MMKQNHQKHPPDILRNKFKTASKQIVRLNQGSSASILSVYRSVGAGPLIILYGAKGQRQTPIAPQNSKKKDPLERASHNLGALFPL